MRPGQFEVPAAVRVAVQVGDGAGHELVRMSLDPLRGPEQARLLAVPGRIDDRATGVPSLTHQIPERAGFLEQRALARQRILGAVDPGVVMVPADDPFVRGAAPGDARDHVIQGTRVPIRAHAQVHLGGTGSDVICDPQAAAPFPRGDRSSHRRQQRLCVSVGDRQHRDLREGRRARERQTLRPPRGADAGREGIPGIERHVHDAAPLHAVSGAPRSLGEHVAGLIPVVARVRVDEAPQRAVLGCHLRLDAAPGPAVTGDHDRPFYRHAQAVQSLIVGRDAVVHVHERSRDVAVGRVGVVGGELLRLLR